MTEIHIIDRNILYKVPGVPVISAPLEKVNEDLNKLAPVIVGLTGLLPPNVRYIKDDSKNLQMWYLLEAPPAMNVRINWNDNYKYGRVSREATNKGESVVSLPWQYFWVSTVKGSDDSGKVVEKLYHVFSFWAQERVSSMDDIVYPALLPNINTRGETCVGGMKRASKPIDDFFINFYSTEFNSDFQYWFVPYETFSEWERAVANDPYWWMTYKFAHPRTLNEIVRPELVRPPTRNFIIELASAISRNKEK